MSSKKYVIVTLIMTYTLIGQSEVTPTFIARSQGSDASRKLVGVSDKVHLIDTEFYANFSVMPEYTRSMHSTKIAQALFGCDLVDCNKILVQGSAVVGRDAKAWLADYFYLAPDYNSYFTIEPVIQNFLVNLDLYLGLDNVMDGMYARFYGPVCWTQWNLQFSQPACGDVVTTGSYSPGYFNATPTYADTDIITDVTGMPNNQLLRNVGQYFAGQAPVNTLALAAGTVVPTEEILNQSIGVEFLGLDSALLEACPRSSAGFADLRGELGWNFYQTSCAHIGINFQIAAPTGSKRVATFAFDSVVGNGNHWEVGGGLTAHVLLWQSKSSYKHMGFYLDANFTHLNKAKEERTFDLCNKPNSRYMLAMKMKAPDTYYDYQITNTASTTNVLLATSNTSAPTLGGSGSTPQATFASTFIPVANLTTMNMNVGVGVQADIAAVFNYTAQSWSLDLGYNFYGRSKEIITKRDASAPQCCPNLCKDYNVWALKGDARVFGFMSAQVDVAGVGIFLSQGTPVRLSATQSEATIHAGTNSTAAYNATTCPGTPTYENCGVDNAQFAYGAGVELTPEPFLAATAGNNIKTSYQPVFINCCDINFQSTRAISNKVFGHISYTWMGSQYKPYLGVGGFGEFGINSGVGCCDQEEDSCAEQNSPCDATDCCDAKCSSPLKAALSQWGVWIKGGIEFN